MVAGHPRRRAAEAFIRATFRKAYAADVPAFAPNLTLIELDARPLAAVGWRSAAEEGLLLERYLDALASHDKDAPLLVSGQRCWWAAEIADELRVLQPRLAESKVVAVLADNGPAWVMADLGIQLAGKVHQPLPAFFTQAQLRHALESSAVDAALADTPERIGALDLGFCHTGRWQGLYWMRRVVPVAALPEGTAKISFTSGSTSTPKGVCLSREGLLDTATAVGEATLTLGSIAIWPRCCWRNGSRTWPASMRRCCVAFPSICRRLARWVGKAARASIRRRVPIPRPSRR